MQETDDNEKPNLQIDDETQQQQSGIDAVPEPKFKNEEILGKLNILSTLQDAILQNLSQTLESSTQAKTLKQHSVKEIDAQTAEGEEIDQLFKTTKYVMTYLPEYINRTVDLKKKFDDFQKRIFKIKNKLEIDSK